MPVGTPSISEHIEEGLVFFGGAFFALFTLAISLESYLGLTCLLPEDRYGPRSVHIPWVTNVLFILIFCVCFVLFWEIPGVRSHPLREKYVGYSTNSTSDQIFSQNKSTMSLLASVSILFDRLDEIESLVAHGVHTHFGAECEFLFGDIGFVG